MAAEYGEARGPGERGRSIIPNHAATGSLAGECAPERVGAAESSRLSLPGDHAKTGRIYRRCAMCLAAMEPVAVEASDPLNGTRSDGYCATCQPIVTREWRADMGLAVECEQCGTGLQIDGACPNCFARHDDPPCADCGRAVKHRTDCPKVQPPTVEELLADAHLIGLGLKELPGGVA